MSSKTHTGSRRPSTRREVYTDMLLNDFHQRLGARQPPQRDETEVLEAPPRHHSPRRGTSRRPEPQTSHRAAVRATGWDHSHSHNHHRHHRHNHHSISRHNSSQVNESNAQPTPAPRATNPSDRRRSLAEPITINPRDALQKERRRPPSLLALFFSPSVPKPVPRVTCISCLSDDIPITKSAKLACSHRMCYTCLRRLFTLSLTDPQHMPPRCCTKDQIPTRYVGLLFDQKFKAKWDQKYKEYTTKNRHYCPSKHCGEWIKPSNIFKDRESGRKYGQCSQCKTKVCCVCHGKWHGSKKECPKDENVQRLEEMAKEKGWQRCYNCSSLVELNEGCNHMTCRCTAQFCMLCGLKWKTCDCPWFNYNTAGREGDQLRDDNNDNNNDNDDDQRNPAPDVAAWHPPRFIVHEFLVGRPRYRDELRTRRDQEQNDHDLAQHLQWLEMEG